MAVGVPIWSGAQLRKVIKHPRARCSGGRVEKADHLETNEQPILHARLRLKATLQLVEFRPVRRGCIVDLPSQCALKISVLCGLSGDEEGDQFTLLRGLQMDCLVFDLHQGH